MSNPKDFNLIMVSAWHEQFGNGLLRFLDGHPNLFAYPFESTMATPLSANMVAGPNHWVPQRYAYPEFGSDLTVEQAYHNMIDHELKPFLRTPHVSKFKNCGIQMNEMERIKAFKACLGGYRYVGNDDILEHSDIGISTRNTRLDKEPFQNKRAQYIEAFFRSTFYAWSNYPRSGQETHYVGYIPPILFDADKFFSDFPKGHMIHIIRNPFSGYADTIKRPFPFSLTKYCQLWNATQLHASVYRNKYPGHFHAVYAEELFADPRVALEPVIKDIGLPWSDTLLYPSFAGKKMEQIYPWGTIKQPTTEVNLATARELTAQQIDQIEVECWPMLCEHGYEDFVNNYLT